MNRFKNDSSNRRYARQAIDGFINTPVNHRASVPRNNNRLDPAKKPVFNDRLRVNLRTPKAASDTDGFIAPKSPVRHEDVPQKPPKSQSSVKQIKNNDTDRLNKRKRNGKNRPMWRKWAIRGTVATVVVVVVLGGLLATKGYLRLNQILRGGGAAAALDKEVDPNKLRGEGDGRINVLLLGRGGAGHDGPDLTDTILVASIDPVNRKSALVSVPRDLWVESRAGDSKINAVFANAKTKELNRSGNQEAAEKAGVKAIENTIEQVLGINMHYYAMVDFKGFEQAVNTVGGVTMNVPEELRDATMAWENNWNPVLAKKGVQKMNGKKALMYVRSRHGSARGDFDRSERQRLFIMALKDKILSGSTYSNPVKISKLMDNFGNHVKTDFSMTDLLRLHAITKGIHDKSIESIGLADPPNDYVTTDTYAGQSVVVPKSGAFDYSKIHMYIRKKLPDGYIIKEKAPIVVLNGTSTEGIASKEAEELKSYSYNVRKVDNAPTQNYTKTVIVELSGNDRYKYTKNYLQKRFKVQTTRKLPEGITIPEQERKGFVIIIGSNEAVNR